MTSFTVKSYSKINLLLKILNKRSDNYHNLYSLFLELNHCDEIIFTKSNQFQLNCEGISVPSDKSNLIYRAYQLIKTRYKIKNSLSIHLKKKIPVFAGLGGGSSNAATTLLSLNKLWKLNLTTENLEKIGSELGADVPFFINGGIRISFPTKFIINFKHAKYANLAPLHEDTIHKSKLLSIFF